MAWDQARPGDVKLNHSCVRKAASSAPPTSAIDGTFRRADPCDEGRLLGSKAEVTRTSSNRRDRRVGSGNFTPSPSTESDLTLARHPARATAQRLPPSIEHRVPAVAG